MALNNRLNPARASPQQTRRRRSGLATVIEQPNLNSLENNNYQMSPPPAGRDSSKDSCSLSVPYAPLRRASDGCACVNQQNIHSSLSHSQASVRAAQDECNRLHRHMGVTDVSKQQELQRQHSLHFQQMGRISPHTPPFPSPPPPLVVSMAAPVPMVLPDSSPIRQPGYVLAENFQQRLQLQSPVMSAVEAAVTPPLSPTLRSISQGTSGLGAPHGASTSPHSPSPSPSHLFRIQEDSELSAANGEYGRTLYPLTPGSVDSAITIGHDMTGGRPPQISITDEQGEVWMPQSCDTSPDDDMMVTPTEKVEYNYPLYSMPVYEEVQPSKPSIVLGVGVGGGRAGSANNKTVLQRQNAVQMTRERHEAYIQNESHRYTFPLTNYSSSSLQNEEEVSQALDVELSNSGTALLHSTNILNMFSPVEKTSSGTLTITLADSCSHLASDTIIAIIKDLLARGAPQLVCQDREGGRYLTLYPPDRSICIELQVYEGQSSPWKGLKLRRISGNYQEYSELCQQVLTCINS